jgi:hypothetical protein
LSETGGNMESAPEPYPAGPGFGPGGPCPPWGYPCACAACR